MRDTHLRLHALLLVAWVALAAAPFPGAAQPTVRVRAETRIELGAETDALGGRIRGRLYDDRGDPLPREHLTLRVRGPGGTQTHALRSDALGWFEVRMPLATDASYEAEVSFEGNGLHERALVRRTLDLRRSEVRLEVEIDERLDLSAPEHPIVIRARGAATGADLGIDVEDELGRPVASGRTDAGGELTLALPSDRLGPPGHGRLTVRTGGDDRRASARTELAVLRVRPTRLSLTARCDDRACEVAGPSDDVRLLGTLDTTTGPLGGRAIGLYRGARHIGTVLTDDAGGFEFVWQPGPALPRAQVVARFESDTPGLPDAQSAPVDFEVTGSRLLLPVLASVLPLALLGLALLLWRRRLRIAPPPPAPPVRAGVQAALPAGRARKIFAVRGRMLAQRDEQPLAGRVEVLGATQRVELVEKGTFEFELARGAYTLRFIAPSCAPAEVQVEIPHRGEWSGMEVRVETWRARVLRVVGRLGQRVFGRRWERRTVHELATHAEAPADVRAVAEQAEKHAYGPVEPNPERVQDLDERARGAADRL